MILSDSLKKNHYIAVLGFAQSCPQYNLELAFFTGQLLAQEGYMVCAGNIISTFSNAFRGAKLAGGTTLAVLENTVSEKPDYCDMMMTVSDSKKKHDLISKLCEGAIIIGGGLATKKIEQKFIAWNKPVTAIRGSGGITDNELSDETLLVDTVFESIRLFNVEKDNVPCYQ